MKKIYTITLIFFLFGQIKSNAQLPVITLNATNSPNRGSIVYKNLKDKYDFIISFHVSGGWRIGDTASFDILARKNKTWKRILLKYQVSKPTGTPKIEVTKFGKQKANRLMERLGTIGFWSLNNDSLNLKEIKPNVPSENFVNKDTVVIMADRIRRFSIVDGTSYNFEIIQKNAVKTYHCESPDAYLRFFPEIKSTSIFIKAIEAFDRAMKD